MKMPFGKYKGRELNNIPFKYISWLTTIELKGTLKAEVAMITQSTEYLEYVKKRSSRNRDFDQSYRSGVNWDHLDSIYGIFY